MGELGWFTLQIFSSQDDRTLGYEDVSIGEGWTLQTWLGLGLISAVIYAERGTSPRVHAVCKVCLNKTTGARLREMERASLAKIPTTTSTNGPTTTTTAAATTTTTTTTFQCIPPLVAGAPATSVCGRSVLITTPRGLDIPIACRLPVSAYAPIVLALQYAHEHDLYHDDIALQSILGVESDSSAGGDKMMALLNDFWLATGMAEIMSNVSARATRLDSVQGQIFSLWCALSLSSLIRQWDKVMCCQLFFWEQALEMACSVQYSTLHKHLLHGGRTSG